MKMLLGLLHPQTWFIRWSLSKRSYGSKFSQLRDCAKVDGDICNIDNQPGVSTFANRHIRLTLGGGIKRYTYFGLQERFKRRSLPREFSAAAAPREIQTLLTVKSRGMLPLRHVLAVMVDNDEHVIDNCNNPSDLSSISNWVMIFAGWGLSPSDCRTLVYDVQCVRLSYSEHHFTPSDDQYSTTGLNNSVSTLPYKLYWQSQRTTFAYSMVGTDWSWRDLISSLCSWKSNLDITLHVLTWNKDFKSI